MQRSGVRILMDRACELSKINYSWRVHKEHVPKAEAAAACQDTPPVEREPEVKDGGPAILVLRLFPKAVINGPRLCEDEFRA